MQVISSVTMVVVSGPIGNVMDIKTVAMDRMKESSAQVIDFKKIFRDNMFL